MSDFYILALLQKCAPPIDVNSLYDELNSIWNVLDMRRLDDNEAEVLMWDMDIDGSVVTAYVGKDGKSLTLDGSINPVAKFVVWYRKYIANEYVLSLFEQSYEHGLMEINVTTTEKDIIQAFWP